MARRDAHRRYLPGRILNLNRSGCNSIEGIELKGPPNKWRPANAPTRVTLRRFTNTTNGCTAHGVLEGAASSPLSPTQPLNAFGLTPLRALSGAASLFCQFFRVWRLCQWRRETVNGVGNGERQLTLMRRWSMCWQRHYWPTENHFCASPPLRAFTGANSWALWCIFCTAINRVTTPLPLKLHVKDEYLHSLDCHSAPDIILLALSGWCATSELATWCSRVCVQGCNLLKGWIARLQSSALYTFWLFFCLEFFSTKNVFALGQTHHICSCCPPLE